MDTRAGNSKNSLKIEDLRVYQLARELSRQVWDVYSKLDWHEKKIIGDQFIRSVDSVGANIAEGSGSISAFSITIN